MSVDDNEALGPEDEVVVARLVALAEDWAAEGRLARDDLDQLLDQVALPSRLYQLATEALGNAGIEVDDPRTDDPDDESGEGGSSVDGFGTFLRHTRHEVLTQRQEFELGQRIDTGRRAQRVLEEHADLDPRSRVAFAREVRGGRQAENELGLHNLRLVIHVAKKLRYQCSVGLDFEDLIEEGYLGLGHAIEKWDHTRGLKFSTYATWWIRQSMERAIADKGATIRLPVHAVEDLRRILKAEAALINAGSQPTIKAIAERVEIPAAKVRHLLGWRNRVDSLDRVVGAGDWTVGDSVADPGTGNIERRVELLDLRNEVRSLLSDLPKREAEVISMRFGLHDGRVRTLEEVGKSFGVTRERIRQIESKVLAKLERPARSLHQYLP